MKEKFVSPDNPVLLNIAEPIAVSEINSQKTQLLITRMLDMAYGEQGDRNKPVLVGLAAPQIGISKRIVLVDTGADGKGNVSNLQVFINPEIVWKSEDETEWYEGCYSTDRVCGIVSRPTSVRVKSITREGKTVVQEYTGYVARIFQHEIDHLNGIEFVTHITDDSKLHWVEESEFPLYRDKEAWRNWPNKCPRERWNKIKGITSQAP